MKTEKKQNGDSNSSSKPRYKAFSDASFDEAMFIKAREELFETEENVRIGIENMKQLAQDANLPFSDDEEILLRFLRGKKFKYQESFKAMRGYLKLIRAMKAKHGVYDPLEIRNVLSKKFIGFLPLRDCEGATIGFCRSGVWLDEGLILENVCKTLFVLGFHAAEQPASQINGIKVIVDVKHYYMKEIPQGIEGFKVMFPFLRGYPARVKRVDFINTPAISQKLFAMAKPFLPAKIKRRIVFHGHDLSSLHEFYDPALLPKEFGGTYGSLGNEHWIEHLEGTFEKINNYEKVLDTWKT